MRILRLLTLLVLGTTAQAPAGLVISEIMNNPSGADGLVSNCDEWFEIFNAGSSAVDLSLVRYDDDTDASDGQTLSGLLGSGQYAIVANRNLSTWQSAFGTLSGGTLFVQVGNPNWQILNNGSGDTISLYSTLTSTNIFSITYGTSLNGRSLQFTGSNPALVSPYVFGVGSWQNASSSPGGSSGDYHSAGSSNLQAAPEPASLALMGIATAGISFMARRQRRHALSDSATI